MGFIFSMIIDKFTKLLDGGGVFEYKIESF